MRLDLQDLCGSSRRGLDRERETQREREDPAVGLHLDLMIQWKTEKYYYYSVLDWFTLRHTRNDKSTDRQYGDVPAPPLPTALFLVFFFCI